MVLTAMPCLDIPEENSSLLKIELTEHDKHDHQNDENHCSPFCTCSCCTYPILFEECIIQSTTIDFSQNHLYEYKSIYFSTPFFSIWQPPKIS